MASTALNDRRHVIPRWQSSGKTVAAGELAPLNQRRRPDRSEALKLLHEKRRQWEEKPALPFAADFAATAFVAGEMEAATDAAEFILSAEGSSDSLRRIAMRILGKATDGDDLSEPPYSEANIDNAALFPVIHTVREYLHDAPRNAFLWADLARLYAIIGQHRPAIHAMENALRIAPANRFTIRSAARLAIHVEEADRAHRLLLEAPAARRDPWLAAAEIATAAVAGRSPRLLKVGRALLGSRSFSPFALSELASAIATAELESGAVKRARRLFRSSLTEPSENTVAQGRWAASQLSDLGELLIPHLRRSSEARAWHSTANADWRGALEECWSWYQLEPFSARPCVHGSYVASIALDDHSEAIRIAMKGLEANPHDFTLLNNLAFSLASQGRLDDAKAAFQKIDDARLEAHKRSVWAATRGLLAFRSGRPNEGRRSYFEAINTSADNPKLTALAWLFLAREELLASASTRGDTLALALESSTVPALRDARELEAVRLRVLELSRKIRP